MDKWEEIDSSGSMMSYKVTIECSFMDEPDSLTTWAHRTGAVAISAIVVWLIVRFVNRWSLHRLPPDAP
jgi:hypothetical protein